MEREEWGWLGDTTYKKQHIRIGNNNYNNNFYQINRTQQQTLR